MTYSEFHFQDCPDLLRCVVCESCEISVILKYEFLRFQMAKLSEVDLSDYQETEVSVVKRSKDRIVVELRDQTDIPTDTYVAIY